MRLSGVDHAIQAAGMAGESILLFALLRRDRIRQFPIFSALIVGTLFKSAVGIFVNAHYGDTYKYYFWTASILDECLQLLVLYEIASHVFAPTGKWAKDVRRTLLELSAVSAFVAAVLSLLANPATPSHVQTFILRSDFFSALLMTELFVCMVVLSTTVGLPWKTHAARIAQGFGTYSIACFALDIAKMVYGIQKGSPHFDQLSHARGLVYICCEIYWIATLWAEAPAPSELPEAMRIQIYTLQRQVENDLIRIRSWRRN